MSQDISKIAAGRDVARAVGAEVLTTGVMAGIGATGIGSTAGGTTGALAAIGLGTTPWGWLLGATLAIAGIGYVIHQAITLSDDNIEDLITRIEALDYAGTNVAGIVDHWTTELEKHKKDLQLPLTTTTLNDRARTASEKLLELEKGLILLNSIRADWGLVKPELRDLNVLVKDDIGDFEIALPAVIETYNKRLEYIKKAIQKASGGIVKELKSAKELAISINKLDAEITKLYGKPIYEENEKLLLEYIKRVLAPRPLTHYVEIRQNKEKLVALRNGLNELLKQVKRLHRKSSMLISKRAVKLAPKPTVNPMTGGMRGQKRKPRKPRRREGNPVIENLQRLINDISISQGITNIHLEEDGLYGTNTAEALYALMKAVPELEKSILAQGINAKMVLNVQLMNKSIRYINKIEKRVRALYNQKQESLLGKRRPEAQYTEEQLDELIIRRLKGPKMTAEVGGEQRNLYELMKTREMSERQMIKLIKFLYGKSPDQPWDPKVIVKALGSRYSVL